MGDLKGEELLEEASRVTDRVRELQEEVAAAAGRTSGEEQSLRQRVSALDSILRHVSSLKARHAELDPKILEKVNCLQTPFFYVIGKRIEQLEGTNLFSLLQT